MHTDTTLFANFIDGLKSKDHAETGLLIGYKYQDRSYIYHTIKTPPSEVSHKQISTLVTMPLSIENSNHSDWILQHSKEISRFLPGGLIILGLYSVAEEDLRIENFASVPSQIVKLYADFCNEIIQDDVLLAFHYNSLEGKYIVGNLDIKNKSFSALDVKSSVLSKLEEVRCMYRLNLEVGCDGTAQNLLQNLLREWSLMLDLSVFVIDKQLVKEDMLLSSLKTVRAMKNKNYHTAQVYSKMPGFCCNSTENRVRVTGTIEGVAAVHPKANMKTVKEFVVKDLLYSLKHRLEIVSDGYDPENNPFIKPTGTLSLQLPKRVTFTLPTFFLTGYTLEDPETLKNLVSTLASVKPLTTETREMVPETKKTEELPTIPQPKTDNRFIFWTLGISIILIISFWIKKNLT